MRKNVKDDQRLAVNSFLLSVFLRVIQSTILAPSCSFFRSSLSIERVNSRSLYFVGSATRYNTWTFI